MVESGRKRKVAIDLSPLNLGHEKRGIGVYTKELFDSLKASGNKYFEIEELDLERAVNNFYDIVHFPTFPTLTYQALKKINSELIFTIHDLIPLIYKKHYPMGIRGYFSFLKIKFFLAKAGAIITDSETSKKDIVRFFGIVPEKIEVIHLAPKKIFKRVRDKIRLTNIIRKYNLPRKFVLYVGDLNYNKNLITLIKACKICRLPLVICGQQSALAEKVFSEKKIKGPKDIIRYILGKTHPEIEHLSEIIKEFETNRNILRLGFVPDSDLAGIYSLASVYCQPSLYEGFGLPVLEAMACGCPVVVSKTNALVEVAGDLAVKFEPENSQDLSRKLKEVVDNPEIREKIFRKTQTYIKKFSWTTVAKETLNLYLKVIKRK